MSSLVQSIQVEGKGLYNLLLSVGDKSFTPSFANKRAVTVSVFRRFRDLLLMNTTAENNLSTSALECGSARRHFMNLHTVPTKVLHYHQLYELVFPKTHQLACLYNQKVYW